MTGKLRHVVLAMMLIGLGLAFVAIPSGVVAADTTTVVRVTTEGSAYTDSRVYGGESVHSITASLPPGNVHAGIAKSSTVGPKKWTNPGSVIGSSCGGTRTYCDRTASASASDAVQPASASSASTEEQLCALFGMDCNADYSSSVDDASPPSKASPSNPPSATKNDGAKDTAAGSPTLSANMSGSSSASQPGSISSPPSSGPSSGRTLVFDDEFDGTTLNSTKWSTYYGNGIAGLRRPSAVSLDGQGHLVITAQMLNGSLVSGGMSANYSRTYGYYEFRVRTESDPTSTMSGVVLTWPQSGNWPTDGENDMYETGTSPSRNPFATFVHYSASNQKYYYMQNVDATEWHTIGMDWEPSYIKIYRDGVLVWTLTDTNAIPDVAHHVALQLDAMVNNTLTQAVHMYVDYVRVYQ